MSWIDWCIMIIPVLGVLAMGMYSRRYARSVADFLSAGRIAGRYILNVGDIANALSIVGIVSYIEVRYKTGFALLFWNNLTIPLGVVMSLMGFCAYRYRETKSMSLGQFLEMRYSRRFRIFAATLRSTAEVTANMIMPAIAARFFIYFLDLPQTLDIFGLHLPTFNIVVIICMTLAVSIICMGGTLSLIITDALQGMLLYPLMVVFAIFILCKFNWNTEIVPVMMDRLPQESFLNPFDIDKLRDFNFFFLIVTIMGTILHRASWIGHGASSAAKTPHEQKMSGLLGTWRGALNGIFYVLIAVMMLTLLNHKHFADSAKVVRTDLCEQAAKELAGSEKMRQKIMARVDAVPPIVHEIGVDAPLGDGANLDSKLLDVVHQAMLEGESSTPEEETARLAGLTAGKTSEEAEQILKDDKLDREKFANSRFQQFKTLFHQLMLASTLRNMLPTGMLGLFCLLLVMAMISTDDSSMYSASLTITQDVILPFCKQTLTPKRHVMLIRLVAISVGVIFCIGSTYMSQLDYINLFYTTMTTMWMGGCGPVMLFGLYSRFGTTIGAWTSLLTGMFMAFGSIFLSRGWANVVYPFLQRHDWVDGVGSFLSAVSKPFNPYVVWEMNALKCPINAYEFYFITMVVTLILYVVVSYCTCKTPFNLDRMLHRGIYNLDGENKTQESWSCKTVFRKLLGITPEYTRGDKFIAWFFFIYSIVYKFLAAFLVVWIWNLITPWPIKWWGTYFYVTSLLIPAILAFISTFWFGICGVKDLIQLFRDLEKRVINPLDNGMVDGNVSLADKQQLEDAEKAASAACPSSQRS